MIKTIEELKNETVALEIIQVTVKRGGPFCSLSGPLVIEGLVLHQWPPGNLWACVSTIVDAQDRSSEMKLMVNIKTIIVERPIEVMQ